jgi:hypothetical protein
MTDQVSGGRPVAVASPLDGGPPKTPTTPVDARSAPATPRSGRRRLVAIAALCVVVLVIAELGVRGIAGHLPQPLVWGSAEAQAKVHQMDRLARQGGAPVVFVGTSQVIAGMSPSIVDAALGGRPLAYNAGLSSGFPDLMEPWIRDVVDPRLHPKLMVIGLSSFDVSDAASPIARAETFVASPAGRSAIHDAGPLDTVNWWLDRHSSLWAHRFSLRDPATVLDAIRGKAPSVDAEVPLLEPAGWLDIHPGSPAIAPRVPVGNWSVGTTRVAALKRLIAEARGRGIRVVLVDMPVTDGYVARHPHGEADYVTFRAELGQIAAQGGVAELNFDSLRNPSYFGDDVHLNSVGAQVFTTQLVAALQAGHALDGL